MQSISVNKYVIAFDMLYELCHSGEKALRQNVLTYLYSIQVLPTIYCGQEFGNGALLNYANSSIYYKGIPHNGSPPRRPDDKDGHYVFAIGENLTLRCKLLPFLPLKLINFQVTPHYKSIRIFNKSEKVILSFFWSAKAFPLSFFLTCIYEKLHF